MKLIFIFICAFMINATASVYSQNAQFTFSVKGKTIKDVFRLIEKESQFRFLYNDDFTDLNQSVTIDVKDNRIEDILNRILDKSGITYRIMDNNLIVITPVEMIQGITVTGTVSDKGEPLPGVNVIVKGTTTGVITDINGKFTISVPNENSILVFSFVGYTSQEIQVGSQTTINMLLVEDTREIEEVVVVGYGVQKKVNLTGAVGQLNSEELKDRPAANVSQMLQGAIPGLNVTRSAGRPGSGGSLNIRGTSSINGGDPLVLIDGVPGDINRVNPNDVASISVLKDAASSAIYGARGAFGVILVTTKSSKGGKVSVNYSNNFGWMKPTTRTDYMTNGFESVSLNDEAFRRTTGNTYTRYSDEDYRELEARRYDETEDPSRPWVVVKPFNGTDIYHYYGNYDWYHTVYQDTRPTMRHNISFQGGNDRVNYMLSGSYYREEGMMKVRTDVFDSYNFRGKIDAKLTDWLTISNNTSYYNSKYKFYGDNENADMKANFVYFTVHALPAYAPVNPDGTATYNTRKNNYSIGDGRFANILGGAAGGEKNNNDFQTTTQLTASLGGAWNITGNFTYGMNSPFNWHRYAKAYYSIIPGKLDEVPNFQTDEIREEMIREPFIGGNFFFNFDDNFGSHHFGATGGINYESLQYKQLEGRKKDLLSRDLNDINLGTGTMEAYGKAYGYVTLGFFFRVNYDYAGKYLLEVNGRYDGTSRYGEGKRYGFFPSVSGGWRISEEQFFEPVKPVVSMLKLRASYGSLGNQLPANRNSSSYYPYLSLMSSAQSNWLINSNTVKTNTVSMPAPVSSDLTWEKVATINFGIDLGFIKNKLTASFDLYDRRTDGMLTKGAALPAVFGADPPQRNAADLSTKGFDLSIRWEDRVQVAGKPLSYNIGVSLSDSRSTITRFDNNPNKIIEVRGNYMGSYMSGSNMYTSPYKGQDVGEIWGFTVDGYFKTDQEAQAYPVDMKIVNSQRLNSPGEWSQLKAGDLKYVDLGGVENRIDMGEGTVDNPGDLRVIGNRTARYSYGLNLGANWSGFDFSITMQGIMKQHWYPGNNTDKFWGPYSRPYYSFIPKDFSDDVWTQENPNAYFPIMRGYDALNSGGQLYFPNNKYLQNIGYFRLKNLTIGYQLPQEWAEKVFMQNCRIYLSGENLLTFTKFRSEYIDPEAPTDDVNARVYPFFKTYSFGLDITF